MKLTLAIIGVAIVLILSGVFGQWWLVWSILAILLIFAIGWGLTYVFGAGKQASPNNPATQSPATPAGAGQPTTQPAAAAVTINAAAKPKPRLFWRILRTTGIVVIVLLTLHWITHTRMAEAQFAKETQWNTDYVNHVHAPTQRRDKHTVEATLPGRLPRDPLMAMQGTIFDRGAQMIALPDQKTGAKLYLAANETVLFRCFFQDDVGHWIPSMTTGPIELPPGADINCKLPDKTRTIQVWVERSDVREGGTPIWIQTLERH